MSMENVPKDSSSKETLSKNALINLMVRRIPDLPPQVSRVAGELIFETVLKNLSVGRHISLRGFGRLIPRRYGRSASKKLGLLFHPSPRLTARVNQKTEEKPVE